MDATTEQLRTLAAVLDHGTFDRAAAALHVTSSAISQRIKALEQQTGRVLLIRSKPVRPTTSGSVVVRLARQVALLESEAMDELGLEGAGARPRIPLVINADSLATWVLPALAGVERATLRSPSMIRTTPLSASGKARRWRRLPRTLSRCRAAPSGRWASCATAPW